MSVHYYRFTRPLMAIAMVGASTLVAFAQKPPVRISAGRDGP